MHYRFWVNKEWASFYRNQIATAYKLVKEFDPLGIIKALNSKPAERIYSLRAPHLIDMIKKEIAVLARQHNNANILALPARFLTNEEGIEILTAFLETSFEGGRHQNRIDKIPQ